MSRSSRFEAENKRLSVEVEQMKEVCSRTSAINVKYKAQLEDERSLKEELMEGNSKLKMKVNDLSTRCYQQNEHIRMLESNLRRATNVSMRASRVPVKLIGNVSEIIQNVDPTTTRPYIDLQKKYNELESQHQEALVIIDELEFELGDVINIKRLFFVVCDYLHFIFLFFSCFFFQCLSLSHKMHYIQFSLSTSYLWHAACHQIDHLEMEILRLQQENVKLREMYETTNYS